MQDSRQQVVLCFKCGCTLYSQSLAAPVTVSVWVARSEKVTSHLVVLCPQSTQPDRAKLGVHQVIPRALEQGRELWLIMLIHLPRSKNAQFLARQNQRILLQHRNAWHKWLNALHGQTLGSL